MSRNSQMRHLVFHMRDKGCQSTTCVPHCWELCKRVRMDRKLGVDLQMEMSEGGLKELVLRWFNETQAPSILHNGNFPDWFQGFAARKDAEDLLRDKPLGCFLIRLSDKAIGYILSYKGYDRCRHFVITQSQDGLFVISGDYQTHRSLTELINYYRVSPIQPFGECLTSSYYEINTGELYDVVKFDSQDLSGPGVSVHALRHLWDQRTGRDTNRGSKERFSQQNDLPTLQLPALPPKSKTRKLTGTVSVGVMPLSSVVPPVPKRGLPLSHTLSERLPNTSNPIDAHRDPNNMERMREDTNLVQMTDSVEDSFTFTRSDTSHHVNPSTMDVPGALYSKLMQVESRSRSLPRLDNNMEEEYPKQLSSPPPSYSPTQLKSVTCQTYSLHKSRVGVRQASIRQELQADELEMSKPNPLYQTSEGHRSMQREDGMYAEVPLGPIPPSHSLPDDTYEQLPREGTEEIQSNTYETLEDLKSKKSKSTWGKSNMKWKKFLPEYMKK